MSEEELILELTNVIGVAIASPVSHLAFRLAVYGRLEEETKEKIKNDEEYRRCFYLEVQRLYQPLPWFMRDIVAPIEIDGKEMDSGTFVFSHIVIIVAPIFGVLTLTHFDLRGFWKIQN